MRGVFFAAFFFAACFVWASSAEAQLRAFGEAEGFGAVSTGARNAASPTIYHVTNLNDSGAGSFRDAVSADNRIIVFDVGGYIHLTSAVSARSNLTILGQTAPGDGIGIYGAEVSFFGRTNDIVRYVRFRDTTLDPGYNPSGTSSSSSNCINIGSSSNMIFDHVSCEFAPYNNIDAAGAPNLTFQNSLVAAPIASQRFNFHWESGGNNDIGFGNGTFVNNVFVDGHNRSILAKGHTQFVNNTNYNYQAAFTAGDSAGFFKYDVIGNYFITGPSTTSASNDYYQVNSNQSAYATGNLRDSDNNGALGGSGSNTLDSAIVLASPWSSTTTQLPQLSAAASYAWNIAHSGVSIQHDPSTYAVSPGYDAVDAYMIGEVTTLGTAGHLWTSQTETGLSNGGLGTLNTGTRPTDTDNDGIPNTWEAAHGMNPNSASDALALNPLGYRMIEQYANELTRTTSDTRAWSAATGSWATTANWTGSVAPNPFEYAQVRGSGATNGGVTISSGTATAMALSIGGNGPAAGEQVTVAGGTLNVYDTISVGDQNNATLEINSGTVQAYNIVLGNTVYLPAATNYTGTLLLHGGTLALSQLVLGAGTPSNWTTGGSLNWSGGTLKAIALLNVNVPVSVSLSGGAIDTSGFNGAISSVISGTGGIAKKGTGTLTLSGANTYMGPTSVQGGALAINALTNGSIAGNLGAATASAANLVLDGGTLQYSGSTSTSTDRLFTLTQSGGTLDSGASGQFRFLNTGSIAQSGTGDRTLTLTGTSLLNDLYSSLGDPSTGKTSLVKNGTGRWILTAPAALRSYSGDTTINAGTLMTNSDNPLPFGAGKGNLVINAGATFETNGRNLSINALNGAGTLNQRSNGTKTVTLGNGDASGSFSGVLSNVLTGSGVAILNVSKSGAGTQTLSGPNTYVGTTTVLQGVLQLAANNTLPNASNVVLAGGALAAAGFSDTVGTLSVAANSHLNMGSGTSVLHFNSSSALQWSGTLTIDNWTGSLSGGGTDQVYFGSSNSALTKTQLANIVFVGSGMLNSTLLPTGELVPGRTFVPGDFDRDNLLSVVDIQAMLTALADVSAYQAARNLSANDLVSLGDLSGDGLVDNADVQGLMIALASAGGGGALAAVPEPPAILLAVLALSGFAMRARSTRSLADLKPAACA
jgi:autotransporter-associated beta strand protein